jgi:cyclase
VLVRTTKERPVMPRVSLVLLFSLPVALAASAQQRKVDWDKVETHVQKLGGNVYMVQASGVPAAIGNVGVLVGDDGIVLVDCEYFELGPKLEATVKTISDKPIKYIFNTHWHGDHTGGDAYFGGKTIIIAQENARKMMENGGKLFPPSPPIALPTMTFTDRLSLHTSAGEIQAIHFPHGHTNTDSLIVFPGGNVVQTGDTFVNWEVPGFPAIDQDTDGSGGARGEIAVAEYVLAHTPEDVRIIPGHGVLGTKGDLRKELAVLKDSSAAVQEGINQGKSLEQLKQEKVLAKWDYLNESHHIQSDVYLERLYRELSKQNDDSKATQ